MENTLLLFFSFFIEAVIVWQYTSHHFIQRTTIKTRVLLLCILYMMLFFLSLCRYFVIIGETSPFAPQISIMVMISAVFLLITNLLVFGINQYNLRKNREFTEIQLQLQKEADSVEYYEMLLLQNENQSILIHDIKKHLQSIKLLNEKGEPDKINAYIHQLMEASDLKETSRICDNVMLNLILNRYQRQCREKHIDFHADIRSNTLQHLLQNDLTALFCNLLDNALASAGNVPDAFIELAIHRKENSPFVVIIMINSCPNAPEYDQNGLPVSHKNGKKRHGFGIKSIQKVVKKYQGNMQMYYDNDAAAFHTIITLKK